MIKILDYVVIAISVIMAATVYISVTAWKKLDKKIEKFELERPDLIRFKK